VKLTARGRLRRGANARSTRSRRRPGHLATPTSRRASLERRVSEDAVRYSDEPLLCRRPLAFESASVAKGVRRIFPPSCKTRARKGGVPKKHRRNSGVSVAPVAAGLVRQTVDDSQPGRTYLALRAVHAARPAIAAEYERPPPEASRARTASRSPCRTVDSSVPSRAGTPIEGCA